MEFSASQFGFSQGATTPSPKKSPGGDKSQQREAHGVLPLTMQMYLQATSTSYSEGGPLTVYGLAAPKVSLVGWVEKAEELNSHSEYVVHDRTGTVTVQNYMNHGDKPKEGEVVRVVGEPRSGGILSAINVAVQGDNAWVGFHRLQAVVVHCQHSAGASGPLDYSPVKTEAPAQPQPGPVKTEPNEQFKDLDLPGQIKAAIKQKLKFGASSVGVAVADICDVLRGTTPETEVKTKISDLCNEGFLFETDENFVNLTEA